MKAKLILVVSMVFFTHASYASIISGVLANGKEWGQLSETQGVNYAQLSSICNPVCNGALLSIDNDTSGAFVDGEYVPATGPIIEFTGWTWASYLEVRDLATSFGVPLGLSPISEVNSAWAPNILSTFESTYTYPSRQIDVLKGLIYIDNPDGISTYTAGFNNYLDSLGEDYYAPIVFGGSVNDNLVDAGVWLYRTEVTTVPVPTAVFLFASGLIGLIGMKRKILKNTIISV